MCRDKTEVELQPGFRRSKMSGIGGARTRHTTTFVPSKASPGERLVEDVPLMKESACLAPGSLYFVFDLEVSGIKTSFRNNSSRGLVHELAVHVAGETAYDNTGEALYKIYSDLWQTTREREDGVEYGVASENLRKLVSGDDGGATSGDAAKVQDALAHSIWKKTKNPSGQDTRGPRPLCPVHHEQQPAIHVDVGARIECVGCAGWRDHGHVQVAKHKTRVRND